MPKVASGTPAAVNRTTPKVPTALPPLTSPATSTLPSGWTATANPRSPRPAKSSDATPFVPKAVSREPLALSRTAPKSMVAVVALSVTATPSTTCPAVVTVTSQASL